MDHFVLLDDVQYEKNGWTNRNDVKTSSGPVRLTIPVSHRGHMDSTLLGTRIVEQQNWRRSHLRTIELAYAKAPHFAQLFPRLATHYEPTTSLLTELLLRQLRFWLRELAIPTPISMQSELEVSGQKSELLVSICQRLGATSYLSGSYAANYMDEGLFRAAGIEVVYQEFEHPVYPQLHGEFLPNLAVVDALMNTEGASLALGQ